MKLGNFLKLSLIASCMGGSVYMPTIDANAQSNAGGVSGLVWIDKNANSKFDLDELPAPNVTVRLYGKNGVEIDKVSTDETGIYNFNNVPVSSYKVSIVYPNGYSISPIKSLSDVDGKGNAAVDLSAIHFKTVNAGLIPSVNAPNFTTPIQNPKTLK